MMKISKEKPLPWPLLNQCLSVTSLPESEADENSLPPSNIFFRRRASGEESMVYKPLNLKPRTVPSENGGSNTSSAKDIPNSDSSSWRKKSISTATGYGLTKEERREKDERKRGLSVVTIIWMLSKRSETTHCGKALTLFVFQKIWTPSRSSLSIVILISRNNDS